MRADAMAGLRFTEQMEEGLVIRVDNKMLSQEILSEIADSKRDGKSLAGARECDAYAVGCSYPSSHQCARTAPIQWEAEEDLLIWAVVG